MKFARFIGVFQIPNDFQGNITDIFELLISHRKAKDLDNRDKSPEINYENLITSEALSFVEATYAVLEKRVETKQREEPDFKHCSLWRIDRE